MPLTGSLKDRFHEFRHGKTYAKTRKKHGKDTARRQMIAVALNSGGGRKSGRKKRRKSGTQRSSSNASRN